MIAAIFILIFIAWAILLCGFFLPNDSDKYALLMFSSMLLLVLGVFMIANGLEEIRNFATDAFSFVHIGVGAYVLIRANFSMWGTK